MKTFRSVVAALLMSTVGLLTSGCWNYRDLEERILVMGIAIDAGPTEQGSRFVVTVEVANAAAAAAPSSPGGGKGGGGGAQQRPNLLVSEPGQTLFEAFSRISGRLERRPIWQQATVVVLGEEAARRGMGPIVEPFLRNPRLSVRSLAFVADGAARDVLSSQPAVEKFTSAYLESVSRGFREHPRFAPPIDLHTVVHHLEEGAALIPRVRVEADGNRVGGAGVLKGGRLIGWLDEPATEGAAWLLGRVRRFLLDFPCPGAPAARITLLARASGTKLRVRLEGGVPRFEFTLSASASVLDLATCPLDPTIRKDRARLEEPAARLVEARARAAIQAQRDLRADFLRLALSLKAAYPDVWREMNWEETLPIVPVSVQADLKIQHIGNLRTTLPFR